MQILSTVGICESAAFMSRQDKMARRNKKQAVDFGGKCIPVDSHGAPCKANVPSALHVTVPLSTFVLEKLAKLSQQILLHIRSAASRNK